MKTIKIHNAALRLAILAAFASVGCIAAYAAEPAAPQNLTITTENGEDKKLDQLWQVAGDAMVEINNVRGSVIITAGDTNRVKLSGSLGNGSKLVVSGSEHHLQIGVEAAAGHGWFGKNGPDSDSDLILSVPRTAEVKVDAVSADIKVSGVDGKSVSVGSVSGDTMVGGNAAQVDIETVSGDVKFDSSNTDPNGRVHLQTVSGDVAAKGGAGRIKLETVSGEVVFRTKEVQEIEAGTVSGTIEIHAIPGKHARIHLDTMSGSVRAFLPASLSARIEGETFSGSLHSDFGKVEKPEYGPGSSLNARVGEGDAQINVQAFSGDVTIAREQGE